MALSMIRLGTCSPASQSTTAETLTQLSQIAESAATKKIDILLLPEAYIGGYPRGAAFGCVVGNRSAEGRDEYLRYFHAAVDLGDTVGDGAGAGAAWVRRELGPDDGKADAEDVRAGGPSAGRGDGTREELERIAHGSGVFLVTGCIEKAGGSLYCSVVYVCPKLGVIGKRRKVMATGTERLVWAQGSPATLRAVSTSIRGIRVNLAAAICWESYMPLLRHALYSQNINLYLAPTADGRDTWLSLMRTVAMEGRCFVLSSNMCVREKRASIQEPSLPESSIDQAVGTEVSSTRSHSGKGPSRRRNSCVTEEGFEIALPSPIVAKTRQPRRESVFDEDGNEIVLCWKGSLHERERVENVSPRNGIVPRITTQANGTPKPEGFTSRGGSSIVSPFGDVLAGPQWEDDEGLIYADVDVEDCIRGRLDLDAAGSYSRYYSTQARNDSFKFSVNGLDLSPLPY